MQIPTPPAGPAPSGAPAETLTAEVVPGAAAGAAAAVLTAAADPGGTVADDDGQSSRILGDSLRAATPQLGRWGQYDLLEVLGQGGMGVVLRAVDRRLGRQVALKLLSGGGPGAVERFQREARAQARVDHEGVCRVYEVGELQGRPYIAMQLIDGKPLDAFRGESLEGRARLVRDVALAVQAAHALGIVHRDLKPSNVLVERRPDGALRPVVMDFGVARDGSLLADSSDTGMVVGTPQFMAPEQARGERVDRRADVYALGAILYDLLVGTPPHSGASVAEVLLKVVREDPAAPRQRVAGIPADLDTVVCTCLARDPDRRYPSARALAEDLGRFLEGEPIAARAEGTLARWVRRAKRNRALTALTLAAVVGVGTSAALAVEARLRAQQEVAYAADVGREVEEAVGFLRYAETLPLHPTSREEARVRERMATLRERAETLPAHLRGASWTAVGRICLALGEPGEAVEAFTRAARAGADDPVLHLEWGRALVEEYRRRNPALLLRSGAAVGERMGPLKEQLLQPALEHLRRAEGAVGQESPALLAGWIARLEGRVDDALAHAARAREETPWSVEPLVLSADALVDRAHAAREAGQVDAAEEDYPRAAEVLRQAEEVARSDERLRVAEALVWLHLAYVAGARGDADDGGAAERGLQATEAALTIDPESLPAMEARIAIWSGQTSAARHLGLPLPDVEGEIRATAARARQGHESAYLWAGIGGIWMVRAMDAANKGNDASSLLADAEEGLRRAVELDPDIPWGWGDLASVMAERAAARDARGDCAEDVFDGALDAYARAAKQDSGGAADIDANYAYTAYQAVTNALACGRDPSGLLSRARDRTGGYTPTRVVREISRVNFGWLAFAAAEAAFARGEDPTADLESARAWLATAWSPGEEVFDAPLLDAAIHELAGRAAAAGGRDPTASLDAAAAALGGVGEVLGPLRDSQAVRVALTREGWHARQGKASAAGRAEVVRRARRAVDADPEGVLAQELLCWALALEARAGGGTLAAAEARRRIGRLTERAPAHTLAAGILAWLDGCPGPTGEGGDGPACSAWRRAVARDPALPRRLFGR